MKQEKIIIRTDSGEQVEAQAPVIVSASRATDIPAFYADWFFDRLDKGYAMWRNPYNGVDYPISFANTRFIVFWSKNPQPLIKHLPKLKERGIGCYVQFTLNDYDNEGLEPNVPVLEQRIDTFKALVDQLGVGHIIWRFDPLILTDNIRPEVLIDRIRNIGNALKGHTEKLVFSFADIAVYSNVCRNLERHGVKYREWTEPEMHDFAQKLSELNKSEGWNYQLATCAEKVDLSAFGIKHNRCIDNELIVRLACHDNALMDCIGAEIKTCTPNLFGEVEIPEGSIQLPGNQYAVLSSMKKDSGQRTVCGCCKSKDIGQYNSCPHSCLYCYANRNPEAAIRNYHQHLANPFTDKIH